MLRIVSRKLTDMNRRHLTRLRRAFAGCGYPVDDLDDSRIEAAVTNGERRIADVALTSQSIYFALRRLSKMENDFTGNAVRRCKSATRNLGGINHGYWRPCRYGFISGFVFRIYLMGGNSLSKKHFGETGRWRLGS